MTRLCDACGARPAVIYQHQMHRALCRECFMEDIASRVKREVQRWRMIEEGDKVLLAISGGKDSFVLLDVLSRIHRSSKLIGLSIIEGIPGYNRKEDIIKMREYARERGVDLLITSIREYVGLSLNEIVRRARSRGVGVSPCTYCGMLRRRIINFYARMLGATKVATAHNLDDEAQTVVVNILRGDVIGLMRAHPLAPPASKKLVQRIKPLRKVYEWENAAYAYYSGFKFQEVECTYINLAPTLRARIRRALQRMERERPGILLNLLEMIDDLIEDLALSSEGDVLGLCELCGEPTTIGRRYCKICELLGKAGIINPIYRIPSSKAQSLLGSHTSIE